VRRKETLSAGLIGCGEVADRYADALSGAVDGLWLQALWDLNRQAGLDLAERSGVALESSLALFCSRPFDLVCVCTPNHTHHALVETLLENGFNVLVEHPLAVRVESGEKLCRLAVRRGRHLFVMRQRRFLPSVQLLRVALARELLGEVKKVNATVCWSRRPEYFAARSWRTRRENGGVVLNQGSHFLDILQYLFGNPRAAEGVIGNIRHCIPVEDAFHGWVIFRRGLRVEFSCTTAAPHGENWSRLLVSGTRGSVALGGKAWEKLETVCNGGGPLETPLPGGPMTGDHVGFLQRVGRRLAGEEVEVVEAADEVRTSRLIASIYQNSTVDASVLSAHFRRLFNGAMDSSDCA